MTFHRVDGPRFVDPLPVDGHLGCFPFLAAVNSAAVSVAVQACLIISFTFGRLGNKHPC